MEPTKTTVSDHEAKKAALKKELHDIMETTAARMQRAISSVDEL